MFYPEPRAPGSGFGAGLTSLITALETNLDWIRQHTRLLERAAEWDGGGRAVNRLLSGSDIAVAKAWASSRPKAAPEPTSLHLDYIRASEEEDASRADTERQRLEEKAEALRAKEQALKEKAEAQAARVWLRGAFFVMLSLASVGLGYLSYSNYKKSEVAEAARREAEAASRLAQQSQVLAEQKSDEAEKNLGLANEQTKLARLNLYEAEVNRARAIIERAEGLVETGKTAHAIQLAIEALTVDETKHDGRVFYIPGASRILTLSDLVWKTSAHDTKTAITALAASPDQKLIASGGTDKTVKLTTIATGRAAGSLKLEASVSGLAFMPDGKSVVAAADNFVHLIDIAARPMTRSLRMAGHTRPVIAVAVSPDGNRIASASEDGTIRIWNPLTGGQLALFEAGDSTYPTAVAFFPGGTKLAVSLQTGLRVLDASTGATLLQIPGEPYTREVALTPDGASLVAVRSYTRVDVIDAVTGSIRASRSTPVGIEHVAVAADGAILVSTATDKKQTSAIRVLRWPNVGGVLADEPEEIGSHFAAVAAIAPLRDGRVVTGSTIGLTPSIWLWPPEPRPKPGFLLERAKNRQTSCLSVSQRLTYVLPPIQRAPNDWCLTLRKPPYDNGTVIKSLGAIRDYSDFALYNGDFTHALEAAVLALEAEPQINWVEVNKAHALMFLNRWEDARAIYLRRRGDTLNIGDKSLTWEEAVLEDFDALERNGLSNGLIEQVRSLFAKPAAGSTAAVTPAK